MFLALRELKFARARFAIMGAVIALIAVLMVLLSGLSVGLVQDGVSGLQRLPVDYFAFEKGAPHDTAFSRSVVSTEATAIWKEQVGVEDAAAFGNTLVNGHTQTGTAVDLALFGVDPGSFLAPTADTGSALGAGAGEVVVSPTLRDQGVEIGDTITLDRIGTGFTVIGFLAGQATFGHVDVAYTDLGTWQRVKAGTRPGEPVPPSVLEEATAIAVRGDNVDTAAGDARAGTESLSLTQSFGASPGYSAETATLSLIQGFLYAISALVVGAFFTIWTIQRRQEIAVMRAMGAPTAYLLRDSIAQATVLLVVSAGIGVSVGIGMGAALRSTPMPFALDASAIAAASILLIALGLLGAGAAVIRIVRIDPLSALGGNR